MLPANKKNKVSLVYRDESDRDFLKEIRDLFSDKKISPVDQKRVFSKAVDWLKQFDNWDVDVTEQSRLPVTAALLSQCLVTNDDPTGLFTEWLNEVLGKTSPPERKKPEITRARNVTDVEVSEEDKAQFDVIKEMLRELELSAVQRGRFYKLVSDWLTKKGWVVDPDLKFGIHTVAAVERQCQTDDPNDDLDTDSQDLFENWIDQVTENEESEEENADVIPVDFSEEESSLEDRVEELASEMSSIREQLIYLTEELERLKET